MVNVNIKITQPFVLPCVGIAAFFSFLGAF